MDLENISLPVKKEVEQAGSSGAGHRTKSISESWIFTHRSWIGVLCLAPVAFGVVFSRPTVSETGAIAFLLDLLGWLFFLAYLGIRIWASLYIGGARDRRLQTLGPYSITRNPLYTGSFCFAVSVACFLKSPSMALVTVIAAVLYVKWVIPAEEEVLLSIFGQEYNHYRRHTPCLIPRPSLYRATASVEVSLRALRTEATRLFTASLMPIVVFYLLHLRSAIWWPHWFRLP